MKNHHRNSHESVVMGKEPLWVDSDSMTQEELSARFSLALNWYNYFCSPEEYREFVLEYCKKTEGMSKDFQERVKQIQKNNSVFSSIGALCRILSLGGKLPIKEEGYFQRHMAELRMSAESVSTAQKQKEVAHTPDVQQNIQQKIRETISKMEVNMDMFIEAPDYKQFVKSFNIDSWIVGHKLKTYECAALHKFYAHRIKEKEEALTGSDPQLNEAYAYLGKVKLRKMVEFMQDIICTAEHHALLKLEQKPRKKKKKSPEQLTKKLFFQKEDTELGLTSVDPRDIIGASKLVVFNTKLRKMSIYESQSSEGFSVRGSTLLNISKASSKTVRKPGPFLKSMGDGIRSITNHYDALKAKESEPTPRLNQFTIIIKAIH